VLTYSQQVCYSIPDYFSHYFHTVEADWEIRFGNLSLLVNSISTDLDS